MKKIIILFIFSFVTSIALAQEAEQGIAVDLRSSGKIYVVVAVIAVVFLGIALYLFSIDRRLSKVEKEQ